MSKELFFLGEPVEFKPGIKVYPPSVRDVVVNKFFGLFVTILTQSQEEIEDIFVKEKKDMGELLTPMEYMLNGCYNNKEYEQLTKMAFEFFLRTKVDFLYDQKLVIIGSLEEILKDINQVGEIVVITEEEFFDFQNLIRMATGHKEIERPVEDEDPRVKAIKAKARYRDKLKAKQNAKKGLKLFSIMTSICCMGLGLTPLNIGEMSYVAMEAILSQYQLKEKYEVDIDSLLAGADSKKVKPVYWIKNLDE